MFAEVRIIRLPDGRDLAWHEFGEPGGRPVVAFHGTPATGHDFAKFGPAARGFRLIAPDRPGYGRSTYDRRGSLERWTDDVARLADHLGLTAFATLGVSGGGPSAVATARYLPERLTGCAVVSSPAPPAAITSDAGMTPVNRFARRLLQRAPKLAPFVLAPATTFMMRRLRDHPDRALAYMERTLPAADREVLERDDVRAALASDLAQPISRTAGRASVQDYALTEHIPHAAFHRVGNAGHLLVYTHVREILEALDQRR
jgi:pimeloyl-ACP methyl ester carboxylesterase